MNLEQTHNYAEKLKKDCAKELQNFYRSNKEISTKDELLKFMKKESDYISNLRIQLFEDLSQKLRSGLEEDLLPFKLNASDLWIQEIDTKIFFPDLYTIDEQMTILSSMGEEEKKKLIRQRNLGVGTTVVSGAACLLSGLITTSKAIPYVQFLLLVLGSAAAAFSSYCQKEIKSAKKADIESYCQILNEMCSTNTQCISQWIDSVVKVVEKAVNGSNG